MTIAVGLLALLVFVLLGVVCELMRDVRQLREAAGILDRPIDVDIGAVAGTRPGPYGLPSELDGATSAIVLFLSERCGTCRSIAAGLERQVPTGLWIVLESPSAKSAAEFVESYGLSRMMEEEKVTVDVEGEIARRIGLDLTPVGFRVDHGKIVSATTVPSKRYLLSILPKAVGLRPMETIPREREAS